MGIESNRGPDREGTQETLYHEEHYPERLPEELAIVARIFTGHSQFHYPEPPPKRLATMSGILAGRSQFEELATNPPITEEII